MIFPTGVHYHYNISIDFDCDKALPIFLLFSEQTKSLIGFGWGGPFDVPSNEWEKPDPSVFAVSSFKIPFNNTPIYQQTKSLIGFGWVGTD